MVNNICSNEILNIQTIYSCARICTNVPSAPTADYEFSNFYLNSTSSFNTSEKYYKWQAYDGNYLLYDTGWGEEGDLILDFSNGSTFDNIYLGISNIDIVNLLLAMNLYIYKRTIKIVHQVMDGNNKTSEKIIKYYFNETN